jgi:predicted enzyme related to lactoylglutathione lyase
VLITYADAIPTAQRGSTNIFIEVDAQEPSHEVFICVVSERRLRVRRRGRPSQHSEGRTKGASMPHPVVHAEIRSQDPDATRKFFGDLFGWKVASEGAFPGYTFIDTGVDGGTYVAISPRQAAEDEVLFFVAVEDVAAALTKAEELGGTIIQPEQKVPGTSFGVFADPQGHKVGVAANG